MPQQVLPTYGDSLNQGLNSGFDAVMDSLYRAKMMGMQGAQLKRNQRMDDLKFMTETGYDPNRVLQGQEVAAHVESLPQGAMPGYAGAESTPTDLSKIPPEQLGVYGEYLNFTKSFKDMQSSKIRLQESQAALNDARARSFGQGGGFRTFKDESSGMMFYQQPTASGVPRIEPIPGQIQGVDQSRQVANASAALSATQEIKKILSGPRGRELSFKTGGMGATLLSLGDTEAQQLSTRVKEASDVIARMRTGAQINDYEAEYYTGILNNRWRTQEANLDAVEVVERFLTTLDDQIRSGVRIPGQNYEPIIIPVGNFDRQQEPSPQGLPAPRRDLGDPDSRYSELERMGKSEQEIYQIMADEGF